VIGIRDEMGVCLEPPQFVTGLARVPNGTGEVGPSVCCRPVTLLSRPWGCACSLPPSSAQAVEPEEPAITVA
jgi:hypothetical protein